MAVSQIIVFISIFILSLCLSCSNAFLSTTKVTIPTKRFKHNGHDKHRGDPSSLFVSSNNKRQWLHATKESFLQDRRTWLEKITIATALTLSPLPSAAEAWSPQVVAQSYDEFASNYDDLDGGIASQALGIDEARTLVIGQAKGHVLEIGVGTGLNLSKYNWKNIASLTLVDISQGMLQQAQQKARQLPTSNNVDLHWVQADATSQLVSTFGTNVFDTVVDTFSLCVMGNQGAQRCLQQVSDVAKPGAKILLLENNRSNNQLLAWYQDVTAPTAAEWGGKGCVYNQDTRQLILQSTNDLKIESEIPFAAGLFRSIVCTKQ